METTKIDTDKVEGVIQKLDGGRLTNLYLSAKSYEKTIPIVFSRSRQLYIGEKSWIYRMERIIDLFDQIVEDFGTIEDLFLPLVDQGIVVTQIFLNGDYNITLDTYNKFTTEDILGDGFKHFCERMLRYGLIFRSGYHQGEKTIEFYKN